MPTTINRTPYNALVDDDGSGLTGTPWDKNQIKTVLLDPIDTVLAGDLSLGRVGLGTAAPANGRLAVTYDNLTTNDRTVQIDMNVESGTGGLWTGLVANARTSSGSTWSGTGGQIFALATEATTRKAGTAEVYGANFQAKILTGATGGNEITGVEIDCISEEIPATRIGLAVCGVPSSEHPTTENSQASGIDTAFLIANKTYGARFNDGILIADASGRFPIDTDGCILRIDLANTVTIAKGIDFSHTFLTISGNAFASPGFAVDGSGNVTLTSNGPTITLTDNAGSPASSFTMKSDNGEWVVRDATAGTDRLKMDTNGGLVVSGAGPHAIGGAVNSARQLRLTGTFAERSGLFIDSTLNVPVNQPGQLLHVAGTLVEAGSGGHTLMAAVNIVAPTITSGAATVTDAASVYIGNAPSATVAGGLYALFVDAGLSRFDGNGTHVFELPADATDPTAGGGAAAGRIPVRIGGVTKYLAYY